MSMLVGLGFFMDHFRRMSMQVDVDLPLVFVFVGMDFEGLSQSPNTNTEKQDADKALAPGGNQVERQQIPQPKRKQTDHGNAGGMPKSPTHSRFPGTLWPAHRQRRNRCQMVRSGP